MRELLWWGCARIEGRHCRVGVTECGGGGCMHTWDQGGSLRRVGCAQLAVCNPSPVRCSLAQPHPFTA